jgi:hypothetical protein
MTWDVSTSTLVKSDRDSGEVRPSAGLCGLLLRRWEDIFKGEVARRAQSSAVEAAVGDVAALHEETEGEGRHLFSLDDSIIPPKTPVAFVKECASR